MHTPMARYVSSFACRTYCRTKGYSPENSVIIRSSALAYASLQPSQDTHTLMTTRTLVSTLSATDETQGGVLGA